MMLDVRALDPFFDRNKFDNGLGKQRKTANIQQQQTTKLSFTMAGHVLEINPESELVFSLSKNEATPRCTMTLTHGGGNNEAIAFKVRSVILQVDSAMRQRQMRADAVCKTRLCCARITQAAVINSLMPMPCWACPLLLLPNTMLLSLNAPF